LNAQINYVNFHLNEIEFLKVKAKYAAQKSNEFIGKQTLSEAIKGGISFLEKNRNEDNTWSDFMTSMGMGKAWITNYVALQLGEIDANMPILANLGTEVLKKTEKFASYNSDIMQDGDSTNFLVGFLQEMGLLSTGLEKNWYKFMDNQSGGWKTYLDGAKLRKSLELDEEISINAWLSTKVCVSAVSAYVLSKKVDSTEFHKTSQYLLKNKAENHWESYWWTSPIYATAFSIMALSRSDEYYAQVAEASNWLANLQDEEGFWPNPIGKDPSPFYTALALKALCIFEKEDYKNQIAKGTSWLLNHQTLDGSWQTNRILQIPATNIEDPKEIKTWRNSSFGVNCISDDFNRIFTTSTVVNCLATLKNDYVN
jgi:squalene-hopene/tetraprenyl-beta-curcumene cyclase